MGQPALRKDVDFQVVFDKTGGLFYIIESSCQEVGGGYRVTYWNLNRHQRIDLISQYDMELQSSCLSSAFLPKSMQAK